MKFKLNQLGCLQLKRPFLLPLVLFVIIISAACNNNQETERNELDTLFTVNDVEITIFEFETNYVRHLIQTGMNDTKEERYVFINKWIDNLVLAEEAAGMGFLTHPTYLEAIELQQRKTMADVYFVDEMNKIMEPPTDDELRLAYAKSKRKVYVRHLYSRNPGKLVEPYQKLLNGASFIDVANEFYQTAEYDSTAGYLGPLKYYSADDKFTETAFSLNQGEFSQPIRSTLGYHIVYVEYIEFPALLAEDQYQTSIDGTRSQYRLRSQKLKSGDYVFNLMNSLGVEVDGDNILKLRDAINDIAEADGNTLGPAEQTNDIENWKTNQSNRLGIEFDEESVFASYTLNGERRDFTFADYAKWLPYLNFQESRTNPGASVGRALRNEVFFLLADEQGYMEDPDVVRKVRNTGYDMLSQLYISDIVDVALADTTTVEIPKKYRDRMIKNPNYAYDTNYWTVPAKDNYDALRIKKEIEEGADPADYEGFELVIEGRVDSYESNFTLIRDALTEIPMAAYSNSDGWIVIQVGSREIVRLDDSELKKLDVLRSYKAFEAVNRRVQALREIASIELDSLTFNDLYELKKVEASE